MWVYDKRKAEKLVKEVKIGLIDGEEVGRSAKRMKQMAKEEEKKKAKPVQKTNFDLSNGKKGKGGVQIEKRRLEKRKSSEKTKEEMRSKVKKVGPVKKVDGETKVVQKTKQVRVEKRTGDERKSEKKKTLENLTFQ